MAEISMLFTSLIAEAIGLPPDAFDKFFDADQQHKLKIVKYPEIDVPDLPAGASEVDRKKWEIKRQGVGPHKDSMLTSYLLQASDQPGLQAQNAKGEWVDCKPIPGTLVVAIGQGMEALTDGVCASTTHRVLSPRRGEGPRYSVPFFQGVSYDARFEAMDVPAEVQRLRDEARARRRDDVEFTFVKGRWGHLGEATLMNRVKSHPDVGERWVSAPRLLQHHAAYPECARARVATADVRSTRNCSPGSARNKRQAHEGEAGAPPSYYRRMQHNWTCCRACTVTGACSVRARQRCGVQAIKFPCT